MQCVVTTRIKILPCWFQVWQSWPLGNINQLQNAFCRLPLTTVTVQRCVAFKKSDVQINPENVMCYVLYDHRHGIQLQHV